jgi:hypothetical protein
MRKIGAEGTERTDGDGLDDVIAGVEGLDVRLDEVRRARIAAGVARRLDARADERLRAAHRARRLAAVALRWLLPAATAGLAAWFVLPRPAPSETKVPWQVAEGRFDRLEVPAGTRARARLGRADLTVVGPAQLEVTNAAGADVTMRLSSGTLLGDYDGRAGGRLRIETPRLVAEIVGTRFAIEATPAHARVSVQHGRVAVREAAAPEGATRTFVGAGQSWEVGGSATAAMPDDVARLLAARGADATTPAAEQEGPSEGPPTVAAVAPAPRAVREGASGLRSQASGSESDPDPRPEARGPRPSSPPAAEPTPQPPAAEQPPVPLAPAPTAAELYRRAEDAMSRRDQVGARRLLEEIVARHADDAAADTARFELARDALAAGAPARAGRWVDELVARGRDRSLVESARFLKCRIARDGGEPSEARACLERFRADHPRSVRDQEALAVLAHLARERGACDEARALAAEHRRLYPTVRLDESESERARCPP